MAEKKKVKLHNRSDKPDNVVLRQRETETECEGIQRQLPSFMRGYFAYLRGNVLPLTRLNYLRDVRFFCQYLIRETDLTKAEEPKNITLEEFRGILAVDVNMFVDWCREYTVEEEDGITVYQNGSKTLARKKASVSVLFKQLYRDGLLEKNITDGFNPIRVPKAGEREVKALQDDEVMIMLDAVSTGASLTDKERQYWEKTKKR
ncbi:MAG: recombinase, partial [Bacillota bacterium]|nr:recombinase [Bacillota bacterium]